MSKNLVEEVVSMLEMDSVIQENALSSESIMNMSGELQHQSEVLFETVNDFHLNRSEEISKATVSLLPEKTS